MLRQSNFKKLVLNFGTNEGAMILHVMATLERLELRFGMMKNENFVAMLAELADDQLQAALGMTRAEFDVKCGELMQLQNEAAAEKIVEEIELEEINPSTILLESAEEPKKETRIPLRGWFSKFNSCLDRHSQESAPSIFSTA